MKKFLLLILSCFITVSIYAQEKPLVLHPIIGDAIDIKEKTIYFLFPEIEDSTFVLGHIFKQNDDYYLHYETDSCPKRNKLDSLTIKQYELNIEKLFTYYSNLSDTDSVNISINDLSSKVSNLNFNIISPEMRKNLPYESRRYQHLNGEAERQGLWGDKKDAYIKTTGYIELFNSK